MKNSTPDLKSSNEVPVLIPPGDPIPKEFRGWVCWDYNGVLTLAYNDDHGLMVYPEYLGREIPKIVELDGLLMKTKRTLYKQDTLTGPAFYTLEVM